MDRERQQWRAMEDCSTDERLQQETCTVRGESKSTNGTDQRCCTWASRHLRVHWPGGSTLFREM